MIFIVWHDLRRQPFGFGSLQPDLAHKAMRIDRAAGVSVLKLFSQSASITVKIRTPVRFVFRKSKEQRKEKRKQSKNEINRKKR
jgi:hypothetical protein